MEWDLQGRIEMQIHPSDLLLKETFQEPASRCERVSSHVRECPRCQERLKGLLSAFWARKPPDYGPALDRSLATLQYWQQIYARERTEAPRLLTALLDQPVQRQKLLLRNHQRFQTWGLCESLLRHSQEQVFTDAAKSEELAQLALFLSYHLNADAYGRTRIEDLQARAWGYIANSLRVRYEFQRSEKAFRKAFSHLRMGTGDTTERAALLELKALLRRLQRRFPESLQLLRRAVTIFREAADRHNTGRCLEVVATAYNFRGEHEQAILVSKEAIPLLEPSREPRALLCAQHNLVDYLIAAGRLMEAQGLLARVRPLYQQFPEPYTQSRLKWVEGKIARGLGRYREARLLLHAAHDGLLAANLPHDAALASAEIAALPSH